MIRVWYDFKTEEEADAFRKQVDPTIAPWTATDSIDMEDFHATWNDAIELLMSAGEFVL